MKARTALAGLLGLLLSLPAHVAGLSLGMILCAVTGLAPDGPWPQRTQDAFLISFGLWQWLYLIPVARWLHRRWPPVAIGFALSGLFGQIASALLLLAAIFRT
jgi:hypothetical protein